MSGLPEAEFIVSLDTSQLVAGSDKAKQIFVEISNSGTQAMQTVQTQADNTSNKMKTLGDSIERTKGSFNSLIGPVTGLVASSASLYFSFDQLERSSIRVEQSHLRVSKAMEAVKKLQDEGKQGTLDYTQAIQNLQIQQERYDVAQNQINQNLVFMSLNMVTLASSTIPSVIKAVQSLKITQEEFAVVLEATMPWLLAITGGILAWEYAISPLIKSQTGLDLGIQSNIEKMVSQHNQMRTNIGDFNEMPGALGVVDGSLGTTTSSFDTLGNSVDTTTAKIKSFKDMVDESMSSFNTMKTLQNGQAIGQIPGMPNTGLTMSLSPSGDLFGAENDLLEKIKSINGSIADQRLEFDSLGGSIKKVGTQIQIAYGDEGLQQFLNKINEIGHGGKDQIEELAKSFSKLDGTIKTTSTSLDSMKKKADDTITATISGAAYNSKLHDLYVLGLRDFGQVNFLPSITGQNLGMFGAKPFYEGVGYGGISNSGVNTSSTVGGLHNEREKNRLIDVLTNESMFGTGLFTVVKDDNREAVENGIASQVAQSEASSQQWQKFKALKFAGLFNGDPNLSIEQNLDNAEKQYDAIFSPLRSDVADKLKAAHVTTTGYYTGDNRRGMSYVTDYSYTLPSQDEIKRAIADSLFASEQAFQSKVSEAQTKLGLSVNDIINSLSNTLTTNDIQAELDFKSRMAAMSSGA